MDNNAWGAEFAVPSSSEKVKVHSSATLLRLAADRFLSFFFSFQGYMDVKITVGTAGGHSSVPPAHSGIGIVGDIVHAIEVRRPFLWVPVSLDINLSNCSPLSSSSLGEPLPYLRSSLSCLSSVPFAFPLPPALNPAQPTLTSSFPTVQIRRSYPRLPRMCRRALSQIPQGLEEAHFERISQVDPEAL